MQLKEKNIRSSLDTVIDEGIEIDYTQTEEFLDFENLFELHAAGLIESCYVVRRLVTINLPNDSKEGGEIARIEWILTESGYAYMHWTKVADEYKRQGIGSTLRKSILDTLQANPNISHTLSQAHSKSGQCLMESQGFKPFCEFSFLPEMKHNWYAKTL